MEKNRLIFLLLIGILLLATLLRLYNSDRTLINDEVVWALAAKNLATTGIPFEFFQCGNPVYFYWHPPFGILTYQLAVYLLGTSPFAFHFFPILFGLATIAATYFLGKELYSRKTGMIAAFLMAVSSYHVLYSQNVDIDAAFLAFLTTTAVLFFVLSKKYANNTYLAASILFVVLSFFTKFSAFLILVPMILYSYTTDRKHVVRDTALLIVALVASLVVLFLFSILTNNAQFFSGPIDYFLFTLFQRTGERTIQEILYTKAFYIATVTWMLTPFATVLLFYGMKKQEKNTQFLLLASWAAVTFGVFFLSHNLDIGRYFGAALAPIFILLGSIVEHHMNVDRSGLAVAGVSALLVAALAFVLGVNDLQGYHNPLLLVSFYVLAGILVILPHKQKISVLIGGFIGLSLYIVLFLASWHAVQAQTVDQLSQNAQLFGFDYHSVWGNKDVIYKLTPANETVTYCFPEPDGVFLQKNNVSFISVYHFRNEEGLKSIENQCIRKKELILNNHVIGVTCEFDADV